MAILVSDRLNCLPVKANIPICSVTCDQSWVLFFTSYHVSQKV